jgi:hypothetical protein
MVRWPRNMKQLLRGLSSLVGMTSTAKRASETIATASPNERQISLFALLRSARDAGTRFVPVRATNSLIDQSMAAIVLKHDVHGLSLEALLKFARNEVREGIFGTYFFMAPNHPDTVKHYDLRQQLRSMKIIQDMGHEVGLHLDPYFMIHHTGNHLGAVLGEMLSTFRAAGLQIVSMNMHGNSAHQHKDKNGYGTSFEFFEEIARQPDFPELHALEPRSAQIVRENRLSIRDYGIKFWADMPIWSSVHGYVVTNFVSDNLLGKTGKIEVLTHSESANQFALAERQRPGSRNRVVPRALIPCNGGPNDVSTSNHHLGITTEALRSHFEFAPKLLEPAQLLVHPQFYI